MAFDATAMFVGSRTEFDAEKVVAESLAQIAK